MLAADRHEICAAFKSVDRDVPRLGRDAVDPGAHGRIRLEIEPALAGGVRVRVEDDVRERHGVAREPLAPVQVPLHRVERLDAALVQRVALGLVPLRAARIGLQEPEHGDRRLVLVLLPEHPLEHLRPRVRLGRHEARPLTEVPDDRVRLGQRAAVVEHERRHAARGAQPVELVPRLRSVDGVDEARLVRDAEVREQQPHLVAIARDRAVVEQHRALSGSGRRCGRDRGRTATARSSRDHPG